MHLHRSSALGYASAASALHSRVYGACSAEAAASETSGLSERGRLPRAMAILSTVPRKGQKSKSIRRDCRLGRESTALTHTIYSLL